MLCLSQNSKHFAPLVFHTNTANLLERPCCMTFMFCEIYLNKNYIIKKNFSLTCNLNESFYSHAWFCNTVHRSLGKYWFTKFADLPNTDTFHHTISKTSSHFSKIPVFQNSIFFFFFFFLYASSESHSILCLCLASLLSGLPWQKSSFLRWIEKREELVRLPRWFSGKEFICLGKRCRRLGFDPWIGKIPLE